MFEAIHAKSCSSFYGKDRSKYSIRYQQPILQLDYQLSDNLIVVAFLQVERSKISDDPDHTFYHSLPIFAKAIHNLIALIVYSRFLQFRIS